MALVQALPLPQPGGFDTGTPQVSPLVLADRRLTWAQDADRAGFSRPAERLLKLAYAICNERPH